MNRILFFLVFVHASFVSNSQTVHISITDSLKDPVFAAGVFINDVKKATYNGALITLNAKPNDVLKIESYFHNDYTIVLDSSRFVNDTAKVFIVLTPKMRNLDEVVITDEDVKVYYDVKNSNVVDYYPFQGLCYFLLKEANQYAIQLNKNEVGLMTTELNFKPTDLYLDGFGNFHILSADSAYQIWLNDDKIECFPPVSIADFDLNIRPLVGKTAKSVFVQKYEFDHKFYTLNTLTSDSIFTLFSSYDRVGHKSASIQRSKIIAKYYLAVPFETNIIELGLWDGDLVKLAENNDLVIEIGWFRAAMDNPIKCEAFGMENNIAIVDLFNDSVSVIDYNSGEKIKNVKLNSTCNGITSFFYDYFSNAVYLIDQTGHGIDIYELDPVKGELKKVKGIHGIPFVQNVKISGNWVYFEIRERTGFVKVLRQRIR